MRDPSTMHGTVITHFCVAQRQGVKNEILNFMPIGRTKAKDVHFALYYYVIWT